MGRSNVYHNVKEIRGNFGAGDDQIQIADSVHVPVILNMGSGQDVVVYNGSAPETILYGDEMVGAVGVLPERMSSCRRSGQL